MVNFENQLNAVKENNRDIYEFINNEINRQKNTLELIPSENIVSLAVMQAQGSILTNKYSEGYPTKRYYGGNQFIDVIEQKAIDLAKKLFNCEHANVQPHSGANANICAYFALLEKGDTILGMDLGHGGHLTHGHPVTHIGKIFNFVRYKTDLETGKIDYENLRKMALEHKPKLIIAGFSAYSRNLDWKKFREICDEVGAIAFADVAHIAGLIAGKVLENPFDFGFDVVTTTTHKTLRGPRGGMILCKEKFKKQIDKAVFPGVQGGPLEHIICAKAVCFEEALKDDFKIYAKNILLNCKSLEKGLKEKEIKICFGETENHLLLLDLSKIENMTGKIAEEILDECGICCNKNSIPEDTKGPFNPSGLRIGTPLITTRGLKENDCYELGLLMGELLNDIENIEIQNKVKEFVKKTCEKYPIY